MLSKILLFLDNISIVASKSLGRVFIKRLACRLGHEWTSFTSGSTTVLDALCMIYSMVRRRTSRFERQASD